MKRFAAVALLSLLSSTLPLAHAEVGAGLRISTLGFGADIDIGATKWATVRLGYHGINYGREYTDTDVTYDGKLKVSVASAIVDWNVFGGGLHFSLGAVSSGPKVDLIGRPTGDTYTFNGNTYQASEIGSVTGTIKLGKSVSPYVGVGWGNAVSEQHSMSFLFDIGAIHTGTIATTLTVNCNPSLPSVTCDQITADANAERADLEVKASRYRWYPVLSIGLGMKF